MKKNTLIVAVIAIFAMSLTSCGHKDPTLTECLTGAKKGWTIEKATVDHTFTMLSGKTVEDLVGDGYLYDCEKDEIIKFLDNGSQTINPGKSTCEFGYQKEVATTYEVSSDDKTLTCHIPFYYNEDETSFHAIPQECVVVSFSEKELVLRCNFFVDNITTKEKFVLTMTYKAN